MADKDSRPAVFLLAAVVTVLVLLGAYFTDRHGGVDEVGLYNPTYMDVHYGKMTYPVHGYFDSMVVHPPAHYKVIATFMRLGLSMYYAEATPTVLMLLIAIWCILAGAFPAPVKMGLLVGLWTSVSAFTMFGLEYFGMRPEGDLNSAWIAGLVSLESARLEQWNRKKLFLGAALLTYAATLHYYAVPAALGVLVYVAVAYFDVGWPAVMPAVLTITAGALLIGLPTLVLWFIPHAGAIGAMVLSTRQNSGVLGAIREHLEIYRFWAQFGIRPFWLRLPFAAGVPLVLISTPILLAIRSTRVLGLAALPVQLALLLFAWHKHAYYFLNEVGLYAAAVTAGLLTITILGVARRRPGRRLALTISLCLAAILAASMWQQTTWIGGLKLSRQPRIPEGDIARAAAREILGPQAKVASRLALWYAAGAADWYNPERDLLWDSGPPAEGVKPYLSRFDAIAESQHMSNATLNSEHKALLSWYADGVLRLRGFFFAEANTDYTYLLLRTEPTPLVIGFGLKNGQLYRFTQDPGGDSAMIVIAGPQTDRLRAGCDMAIFCQVMVIPPPGGVGDPYGMLEAVVPATAASALERLPLDYKLVQRINGGLAPVDKAQLVAKLSHEDKPIRFHQHVDPESNRSR